MTQYGLANIRCYISIQNSYLDYLDIYLLYNHWKIEVSIQELAHVLEQYSNSFVHHGTIKQINWYCEQ